MTESFNDFIGALAGTVSAADELPTAPTAGHSSCLHQSRWTWRPPLAVAAQVPENFALEMSCHDIAGAMRRFSPSNGVEQLVHQAWLGGLAILCETRHLDREQRNHFRGSFFLFQLSRSMQEYFNRQFKSGQDLTIRAQGRHGATDINVLPEGLGLDSDGRGKKWSVAQLLRQGELAAQTAGDLPISPEKAIQHGLFVAAKLNPLIVPECSLARLIKTALFDVDREQVAVPAEVCDQVRDRIFKAFATHLGDGTETFNEWFSGKKSTLIKQIAKQRRAPGGPLDPDLVRRAIVDIGWQAFSEVGDCIHAQMNAFAAALPSPLDAEERLFFDNVYLQRPCFGNIPLVLLWARARFLKRAMMDLWLRPHESEPLGVLYRLLEYYTEMTSRRRDADRMSKQVTAANEGRGGKKSSRGKIIATPSKFKRASFASIAEQIRLLYKIDCPCHALDLEAELLYETDSSITLGFRCGNCDPEASPASQSACVRELTIKRTEFEQIGRKLQSD
jgi:hypothetical protein